MCNIIHVCNIVHVYNIYPIVLPKINCYNNIYITFWFSGVHWAVINNDDGDGGVSLLLLVFHICLFILCLLRQLLTTLISYSGSAIPLS